MGSGQQESSQGVCWEVDNELHGVEVKQPFFLLELGGVDVVLGIDWLFGALNSGQFPGLNL